MSHTNGRRGVSDIRRYAPRRKRPSLFACGVASGLALAIGLVVLTPLLAGAQTVPAPSPAPWTIDWGSGITFGAVGNIGPHAVADCAIAAVADIEQVLTHQSAPTDPAPYLDAYRALARAAGERPGATAGLLPASVLEAWRTGGIAGTRIAAAPALPVSASVIEAALASGPLYAVLSLPRPVSTAPTWVDASGVATTPWTAQTPPAGYSGVGAHVVAVVGYDAADVLVATWGFVQPISWSEWAHLATAAWQVVPTS